MSEQPNDLDALRRENEMLRERLAHSQTGLEIYRRAVYEYFAKSHNPPPYTDEEIQELISSPRGQPLLEVIDEYERALKGAWWRLSTISSRNRKPSPRP